MSAKYLLAIFDMDGTILNTADDLTDSVNHCLQNHDMPLRTIDEIKGFAGNGARRLIELSVPDNTAQDMKDTVYAEFGAYYKDHCANKTRPYEGIRTLIGNIRSAGILTAVVSNKPDIAVKKLCKDYFDGLFDYYVGDKPGQNRKPAPDSVYDVLRTLDIAKESAVYIGDSEVDYATATNAGIDVIMVSWGFRTREHLRALGAGCICDSTAEVEKCFDLFN